MSNYFSKTPTRVMLKYVRMYVFPNHMQLTLMKDTPTHLSESLCHLKSSMAAMVSLDPSFFTSLHQRK